MRRPLDLRLPKSRFWPRWALVASVGLHVLLLMIGAIEAWIPLLPYRPYPSPAAVPDTVPIIFREPPRPEPPPLARQPEVVRRPPDASDERSVLTPPAQPPVPPAPVDSGVIQAVPAPPPLIPTPTPVPSPAGRIGPGLAQGKLWVPPLPLPPKELARRLTRSHTELVDSAVTAVVQGYLDSIANDPRAGSTRLPSWTTRVAGRKVGLDSTSIYVAGLKIPAAVLALLPIPAGNIDQNRAYNRLLELRADIEQAGRRADNLAEFKERIREIRQRKERDEAFERNRRTPPAEPPAAPPAPPAPPPSPVSTAKDTLPEVRGGTER